MNKIVTAFILFVLTAASYSQPIFQANLAAGWDDNINLNYRGLTDYYTSGELNIGYLFATKKTTTNIYYNPKLTYYTNYKDRTNQSHVAGISVFTYMNKKMSVAWTNRVQADYYDFKDRYDYLDELDLDLTSALEFVFPERVSNTVGLSFRYEKFRELESLTNFSVGLLYDVLMFMGSKSTLKVNTLTRIKTLNEPDTEILPVNNDDDRRFLDVLAGLTYTRRISDKGLLSLAGNYKVAFSDNLLYEVISFPGEFEFNDNIYYFRGPSASVNYTHNLSKVFSFSVGGGYSYRHYLNYPVFDEFGFISDNDRKDHILFGSAGLSAVSGKFGLHLDYYKRNNRSNFYYFDFDNNIVTLTAGFSY